jgi:hypothetical protein
VFSNQENDQLYNDEHYSLGISIEDRLNTIKNQTIIKLKSEKIAISVAEFLPMSNQSLFLEGTKSFFEFIEPINKLLEKICLNLPRSTPHYTDPDDEPGDNVDLMVQWFVELEQYIKRFEFDLYCMKQETKFYLGYINSKNNDYINTNKVEDFNTVGRLRVVIKRVFYYENPIPKIARVVLFLAAVLFGSVFMTGLVLSITTSPFFLVMAGAGAALFIASTVGFFKTGSSDQKQLLKIVDQLESRLNKVVKEIKAFDMDTNDTDENTTSLN